MDGTILQPYNPAPYATLFYVHQYLTTPASGSLQNTALDTLSRVSVGVQDESIKSGGIYLNDGMM